MNTPWGFRIRKAGAPHVVFDHQVTVTSIMTPIDRWELETHTSMNMKTADGE